MLNTFVGKGGASQLQVPERREVLRPGQRLRQRFTLIRCVNGKLGESAQEMALEERGETLADVVQADVAQRTGFEEFTAVPQQRRRFDLHFLDEAAAKAVAGGQPVKRGDPFFMVRIEQALLFPLQLHELGLRVVGVVAPLRRQLFVCFFLEAGQGDLDADELAAGLAPLAGDGMAEARRRAGGRSRLLFEPVREDEPRRIVVREGADPLEKGFDLGMHEG